MSNRLSKYIKQDSRIQGGMPTIVGTRVTVAEIIDYLETDKNIQNIIRALKKAGVLITKEEVFAALEFAKYKSSDEGLTKKISK